MIGVRPLRAWLITDRRLASSTEGVAVVEFGFIAPIFVMLLLAVFDLGFGMYAKTVLQGAVEEASRTASLENTKWDEIKDRVNTQVRMVIPSSDPETDISFELDEKFYENYDDVVTPEHIIDKAPFDGILNPGECFWDRNDNRTHDKDVGVKGRGGAQDVVSIKAEVEFKRAFPLWRLLNQPSTLKLTARTYLRNQPFGARAGRVERKVCT